MQRIERYGVIALVFLLVTILAVAVWGQRKNQSLMSFFRRDKGAEVAKLDTPPPGPTTPVSSLGLSNPSHELTPLTGQPGSSVGASDPSLHFTPSAGPGLNAVTFEQPPAPGANATPGSGFLTDPNAHPIAPGTQTPPVVTDGAPTAIEGAPRTYKVKPGDTLGSIAQHELGSTKRWKEIETLNNVKADRLNVGMVIKLPAGASTEPQILVKKDDATAVPDATAAAGKRTYNVRTGDSLSKIAAAQLGDPNRYAEILALNPGLNPQKLSVGQTLRLPGSAKTPVPAPAAKPKAHPASETSEVAKADPAPKKARVQ
jgi:LysM repeat protein